MNEFEWRRQMHALREPLTPQRDLWTAIDAALDGAEPVSASPGSARHPPAAHRLRWLAAASVAAAVLLAGGLNWRVLHAPAATLVTTSTPTASTHWKPADPRLAGAAIELDAARMELQQAMEQAPDSPALARLLSRTEHQQAQLRQLAHAAG